MDLFQLYRSPAPSGTKDWAIMAHPGGVKIRFGTTGQRLKLVEVPLVNCQGGSSDEEMQIRIRKQLEAPDSDFKFIDQVLISDDGVVGELTNPKLKEKLYWTVSIDAQNQAQFDEVRTIIEDTAQLIADTFPREVTLLRPVGGVSLNGYVIKFPEDDTVQSNGISLQSGHGTGILTFNTGLYPALWMLLIAHKTRGAFQLSADSTPNVIIPYLQPIAFVREEDCQQFEPFAAQHGLLSAEESVLLACKDVCDTVDWL